MIFIPYELRMATAEDAEELLEIYTPYILNTNITFEYTVPGVEDFRRRMLEVLQWHPWLVCRSENRTLGYAYASRYHSRAAYQWDAEGSIYLCPQAQGTGIAEPLYRCLMELLAAQNIRTFYGCITHPNPPSEAFHRKLGFEDIGIFRRSGFKRGQWLDVLWNEISLGDKNAPPQPVTYLKELKPELVADTLARWEAQLNQERSPAQPQ